MPQTEKEKRAIAEITKKYGGVIDLNKNAAVLIEIIRGYKNIFDDDDGGGGSGGVGGGVHTVSSIAVAGPPEEGGVQINNSMLLKEILKIQQNLNSINKKLNI